MRPYNCVAGTRLPKRLKRALERPTGPHRRKPAYPRDTGLRPTPRYMHPSSRDFRLCCDCGDMPVPTSTRPKFAIVIVKRYPRRPDNIRGRRERRADYLPRGRGRAKQVYNHYPYPYTRTYVRANTCSIFLTAYRTYVRYRETRNSLLFFRAPV